MKRKPLAAFGSFFISILAILLLLQGCGDTNLFEGIADDSGQEARIEQARQDLNSGNFDAVIATLGGRSNLSDQERRYLASAYIGKAGFDTLKLLDEFAKNDEGGHDVDAFDIIGGIFGEKLTEDDLNNKVSLVAQALLVLGAGSVNTQSRLRARSYSGSDDLRLQRGIYAAIHAILSISLAIGREYNLMPIPLTTNGIKQALDAKGINKIELSSLPPGLNDDLWMVQDGVNALSGGNLIGIEEVRDNNKNDIDREFSKFLKDIGFSGDNFVDSTDLSNYLNHLIWPNIY
ncbi:MAG: hypothetical protein K6U11_01100 [bacterium]|nr:hypothetical protein [bacterium]